MPCVHSSDPNIHCAPIKFLVPVSSILCLRASFYNSGNPPLGTFPSNNDSLASLLLEPQMYIHFIPLFRVSLGLWAPVVHCGIWLDNLLSIACLHSPVSLQFSLHISWDHLPNNHWNLYPSLRLYS